MKLCKLKQLLLSALVCSSSGRCFKLCLGVLSLVIAAPAFGMVEDVREFGLIKLHFANLSDSDVFIRRSTAHGSVTGNLEMCVVKAGQRYDGYFEATWIQLVDIDPGVDNPSLIDDVLDLSAADFEYTVHLRGSALNGYQTELVDVRPFASVPVNVPLCFSEGFGIGLLFFGFGWKLRLAKRVADF